jgi:hypothetical protein
MEKDHSKIILKSSAIIIGALGAYGLINLLPHWNFLLFSQYNIIDYYFGNQPVYIGVLWILTELIPIFLLISFWGSFQIKKWGRLLAISTLSVDVTIRLFGDIKFWTIYLFHPELREVHRAAIDAALKAQQNGQAINVQIISLWPSYIICIMNFVLLIALFLPAVKQLFKDSHNLGLQATHE